MKIPKEQVFITIIGLFLLSYLLEAIVDPLHISLATPYEFFNPTFFAKYPFVTATVIIRGLSFFLTPLFLFSFFAKGYFPKAIILLVVSALTQLYALQEVTSGSTLVPLEWSLSLSLAGASLVIPLVIYLIKGVVVSAKNKILPEETPEEMTQTEV
jgi:hypothetical protein